ncbi:MAG: hypothetical protein ABI120_12305 [Gemmatimonadaceae bacterium]
MISSLVSRTSAAFLGVLGLALLFGADAILPLVIPAFPRSAVWLGQLIAGAWLALAAMNWQARKTILGGIYGRPVVYSNVMLFVVSALGVFKAALAPNASPILWLIVGPVAVFALVYGVLLFRGPFDSFTKGKS